MKAVRSDGWKSHTVILINTFTRRNFTVFSLQEMDHPCEKACGDGFHANGQSDSDVWSEPLMDPAEPRRPRLTFCDTYVNILQYFSYFTPLSYRKCVNICITIHDEVLKYFC